MGLRSRFSRSECFFGAIEDSDLVGRNPLFAKILKTSAHPLMGLWFLFYFLYLLHFLYVLSFLHLRYNVLHGPSPRTRPHSPSSRRPPRPHRRSPLSRRQAPLSSRPPSGRHRPPRRAHHFLFPHRHLPPPQPWPFFPLLALLPFPPLGRKAAPAPCA